ncbi:MAG: response regulator [Blastochloris sp.]|nr:response regulator [Blastochloris sp.]
MEIVASKWLFVDDDVRFLSHLKESLGLLCGKHPNAPSIIISENVADALLLIQRESPSIVITDIQMPQVDGFQFLRLLSTKYPKIKKVVLTGQSSTQIDGLCQKNGVARHFTKPATAKAMLDIFISLLALDKDPKQTLPTPEIKQTAGSVPTPQEQEANRIPFKKAIRITGKLAPRGTSFSSPSSVLDDVVTPKIQAADHPKGFSGVLDQINISELVQMLVLSNKSSILEVSGDHDQGKIYLEHGQIIHAETKDQVGESAVYVLLNLQDGQFELAHFNPPNQKTIFTTTQHILIEAARLMDEQERDKNHFNKEALTSKTSRITTAKQTLTKRQYVIIEEAVTQEVYVEESIETNHPSTVSNNAFDLQHLDEVIILAKDGKIQYKHGSLDPAQRIDLIAFIDFKSQQIHDQFQLGSLYHLQIIGENLEALMACKDDDTLLAINTQRPLPMKQLLGAINKNLCLTQTF